MKSAMISRSAMLCISWLLCPPAFGAYPLATDDAATVRRDGFELEFGYDNRRDEETLRNHSSGVSFKHGITEKMDVGIVVPLQVDPPTDERWGNAVVFMKFLPVKDIFAVTFSNEAGSNSYFLNGIASADIGRTKLHANLGYVKAGAAGEKGYIACSAAAERPLGQFEGVGEVTAQQAGLQKWLAGVRYRLSEGFFVSAAFENSFSGIDDRVTGGFHYEFE